MIRLLLRLWSGTIPEAETHAVVRAQALDLIYHAVVTEKVNRAADSRRAVVGDSDIWEWDREVAWS